MTDTLHRILTPFGRDFYAIRRKILNTANAHSHATQHWLRQIVAAREAEPTSRRMAAIFSEIDMETPPLFSCRRSPVGSSGRKLTTLGSTGPPYFSLSALGSAVRQYHSVRKLLGRGDHQIPLPQGPLSRCAFGAPHQAEAAALINQVHGL